MTPDSRYALTDRNILTVEGAGEQMLSPYYMRGGVALLLRDADLACPLCHDGHLAAPIKGLMRFLSYGVVVCDGCGAAFENFGNDGYMLIRLKDKKNPVWTEYQRKTLRLEEWERVGRGGLTDAQQREKDLEEWLGKLRLGDVAVTCVGAPLSILLQKDETVLCALPDVYLSEPRAVRRSSGTYGGPRVRVAKGVYMNFGGFQSVSRSHSEIRKVDSGVLTITNRRVVFSGGFKTLNIEFSKILEMQPFKDGIALHRSTSQKTQYFSFAKPVSLKITTKGKAYEEPLSGIILQCLIEGLART